MLCPTRCYIHDLPDVNIDTVLCRDAFRRHPLSITAMNNSNVNLLAHQLEVKIRLVPSSRQSSSPYLKVPIQGSSFWDQLSHRDTPSSWLDHTRLLFARVVPIPFSNPTFAPMKENVGLIVEYRKGVSNNTILDFILDICECM